MPTDFDTCFDGTPNPKQAQGDKKVPMCLFPDTAVIEGARAFDDGAQKYGPYNWREIGVVASTYNSAAKRHLAQWFNGEDVDPVSGVSHLGHALACVALLIDSIAARKLNDDRPPPVEIHTERKL